MTTTDAEETIMSPRWRLGSSAALCAGLIALIFLINCGISFGRVVSQGAQYDDSYITYRYAVNLAEGEGLTFNRFERINSASSLLYTVLLAGAYRTWKPSLETTGALLNCVAGAAALVLAFLLSREAAGSSLIAAVFVLPIAVSGAWAGWATSGMETIMYACLVMATFYAMARDRAMLCAAGLAACLLCRPEAVLLLAAIVSGELWFGRRRRGVMYAAVGAVILCALYGFYALYYGDWLPEPVRMKGIARYYSPGPVHQLKDIGRLFLLGFGGITACAMVGLWDRIKATLRKKSRDLGSYEASLMAFVALSLSSLLVGPRADLARYGVHILPLLSIIASGMWRTRFHSSPGMHGTAVVAVGSLSLVLAIHDLNLTRTAFNQWSTHQNARKQLGKWIHHNAAPGSLVLSSDLGAIAFVAQRQDFYDILGLLTRAPVVGARERDWASVAEDIRQRAPMYVADTVPPGGRGLQAIEVMKRPDLFFRGMTIEEGQVLPAVVEEVTDVTVDGYKFAVARLWWARTEKAGRKP